MTTAHLVAYIRSHGFSAELLPDGKTISAEMVYCQDRKAYPEWETIPANYQAVRAWLGY